MSMNKIFRHIYLSDYDDRTDYDRMDYDLYDRAVICTIVICTIVICTIVYATYIISRYSLVNCPRWLFALRYLTNLATLKSVNNKYLLRRACIFILLFD